MKSLSVNLSSPWSIVTLLMIGTGLASVNRQPIWGLLVVAIAEGGRRWRADQLNLIQLRSDVNYWLLGWGSVLVATLNPNRVSQVSLIVLYGMLRLWLFRVKDNQANRMLAAAITQGVVLWAAFLAAAVWQWQTLVLLILVWTTAWLIARQALEGSNDRAAGVLALTWALIVAECSWVFSLWLVNYVIFNGILIVPQPALVVTALGYCLAGIYMSHRRSQLSRSRLVEYLTIGLVILIIVIAGTKWNGVI
jgi:hypothetical protein